MGFIDSIFGSSPDVDWRHKRTGQQVKMGRDSYRLLRELFKPGGFQNLLPTTDIMQSLDPSIYAGAQWGIEQGANQLQERLGGMGFSGGSGASAMGQYYGNAQPQIYSMLANMISGAQQMPYRLGAGLWPSTQQNTAQPIVSQGSPGLLSGAMQMAAPWAMSFLPWGNFGGMMGGGSPFGTTLGGQYANF